MGVLVICNSHRIQTPQMPTNVVCHAVGCYLSTKENTTWYYNMYKPRKHAKVKKAMTEDLTSDSTHTNVQCRQNQRQKSRAEVTYNFNGIKGGKNEVIQ